MRSRTICTALLIAGMTVSAMAEKVVDFNGSHGQVEGTELTKGSFNSYAGDNPGEVFYDGAHGPLTWWAESANGTEYRGMRIEGANSAATVGVYWAPGGSYTFDGMAETDVLFAFNEDQTWGDLAIYDNLSALVVNDGVAYTKLIDADPGIFEAISATKADLAGTWTEYDMSTGAAGEGTIDLVDLDSITAFGGAFTRSGSNIFISSVEAYAVPEPASMTLLGLGGLAVLIRRRRK